MTRSRFAWSCLWQSLPGAGAIIISLVCQSSGLAAPNPMVAMADDRQNADRLLVVDCMLPGQVRQLGTGITYMAPRRAIKTTGSECAIRGGEYVAYDRSNYATALKVWLPSAQGGDKVAQTNVGEIYEKGLGTTPDYANAALWYQKAADQGYSRALINLGFLYEQGLGVPRDQANALKLYRKAAGLEGSINLDGAPATASKEELDSLRKELERTRQELEKARRALDEERLKSSQEIERLTKQKLQAAAAGNTEETRRLESLLKERETELEKRRAQVAQSEQASEDYKARLARLEGESVSLRSELEQARRQLAQSQRDIEDKKNAAAEAQRRLDAMQSEIARQKNATASVDPGRIKALEAELDKSKTEFARQKQEIARLETDVSGYKEKIGKLELRPDVPKQQPARVLVAMAPPSIQIIDPPIVVTRDTATIKVRSGVSTRPVVGRVTAAAGLLSFTANDVLLDIDGDGMFKTSVDLGAGKTRVTMVAVDRQGKRAALEFFMEPDAAVVKPIAAPPPKLSGQSLGLGKYYALVIGNQKYQKLQRLSTPEADASDIAALLKDRYGFTVTLLLNATRWEIMEELNKLRSVVTEKDNLLVYYAGHGQIDRVNSLANWLPIDADATSTANWIANSTLTETWNTMSAKHILVVADSCYSGAMTRSSMGQLQPGLSEEERLAQLKSLAVSPSRTVLTSGGVSPVMDGGGGRHSIFAQNFIDILSENQDFLLGRQLSDVLSARVLNIARRLNFEQRPEYAPIRFAGGESGDFIFSPPKI
jgi:caspase domain-containing protein/Sel1 repeat-containing protein